MTIGEHIETFAGRPVVEFDPAAPDRVRDVADPAAVAWRISQDYEDSAGNFAPLLRDLVRAVGADSLTALVVGEWGSSYDSSAPIAALVDVCAALPNLRALFLGEMTYEECEISWIQQSDITPLLRDLPQLEVLWIRGGTGLALQPVRNERLRELAFEAGGLPAAVVRAVGECEFPALEHLELWLGTAEYGGDAGLDDLAGVLSGARLPALRSLGLRDAQIADEVAAALAAAPVVARLTALDLSLGTLSDTGVSALLSGQPLTHLTRLNLAHHYITGEMAERLRAELPGVELDLSDDQLLEADEEDLRRGRFVAVSE